MKINTNYANLKESYLFSTIAKKVAEFTAPADMPLIRLGIGDVTRPLGAPVVKAMEEAAAEQGKAETFHGYGPEQGYGFLREAISAYHSCHMDAEDIFVSDGAKSDIGNILDLFDKDNVVAIPDPVYPVYMDTNLMDGREIKLLPAGRDNGFLPMPVSEDGTVLEADIVYLCSPNNPTGASYNKEQLKAWVDWANEREAIILFDAAYEAFITTGHPRSIYEIEGALTCSIEFSSFSKLAGFTGTRCGYTIVPKELIRQDMSLRKMWLRRQSTKFNGVSYPVQKAAAAVFTEEGMASCRENLKVYQENAMYMAKVLTEMGVYFTGGVDSPYIWMEVPAGMTSWEFFDDLLTKCAVVGTPGSGFGASGEGFFRLTAFNTPENTREAMERIRRTYGNK